MQQQKHQTDFQRGGGCCRAARQAAEAMQQSKKCSRAPAGRRRSLYASAAASAIAFAALLLRLAALLLACSGRAAAVAIRFGGCSLLSLRAPLRRCAALTFVSAARVAVRRLLALAVAACAASACRFACAVRSLLPPIPPALLPLPLCLRCCRLRCDRLPLCLRGSLAVAFVLHARALLLIAASYSDTPARPAWRLYIYSRIIVCTEQITCTASYQCAQ